MTEEEKITRLKEYSGYKNHTHPFFENKEYTN